MSSDPIADSAPSYGEALSRRFPALSWIRKADDAVYGLERVAVTMAMLVMSAVVCINVLFQFLARQRAVLRRLEMDASLTDLWPTLVILGSVAVLARGAWAASPTCRGNRTVVALMTTLTVIAFAVFAAALLFLPSHTVIALCVLFAGAWVALAELDRPRPLGGPLPDTGTKVRIAVTLVVTVLAGYGAFSVVPERYSWTTKLALFLLLWTAFIGASMATHDGRHLTIDAVRKALPARILPYYQGVSHLLAAAFTAVFTYLAWLYLVDRLAENTAPGEIPDWLKVLAIPVSLALVTLRFIGQSIAGFAYGALGMAAEADANEVRA